MGNLVIRGLGVPDFSVPSRGFTGLSGPGATPTMLPTQGITLGGAAFAILNSGLSVASQVDSFPGGSLSGAWTSASTGGGSVVVNDGLFLNNGTVAGSSSVTTAATYKNFDVTVLFQYDKTVEQFFPTNEITYLRVRAKIDANNHFTLAHIWNPAKGPEIRVSVTTSGVTSIVTGDTGRASARALRLIRYDGRMQAYAGSVLLADFHGWRTDTVSIELASESILSPVPLSTEVILYQPQLMVTFGAEIAPFVNSIANRIVGSTPAYKLPGIVEVKVHSTSSTVSLGEVFTYVPPLQLTVSGLESTTIIVNDDDQLRDSTPTLPGLRL